jgi:hypothetical protein
MGHASRSSTFSYQALQQILNSNLPGVATLDFLYASGGQITSSPLYYQWQYYYSNQKVGLSLWCVFDVARCTFVRWT